MYIEHLFKLKGVIIERQIESHYIIHVPNRLAQKLLPKIADIFLEHYETVRLIDRSKRKTEIRFVVVWLVGSGGDYHVRIDVPT